MLVTAVGYRTCQRYSSGIEKTILRRRCDESSGFSTGVLALFLSHDCSIEPTSPASREDSSKERERDAARANENRAGSAGHYLLLTIFMCLSIAEISTRCDDID